ncbi:MAG: winged helix-turn-helix transcriptional regulator [Xanthobacteraceae bacterium]|nr:winged helix-turn-helix transcriptional regulator [Xanthobacteraceae bacterium]MBX3523710.1 winged helix-turn-helix transcriptional regulator [Xanthobacteraceae bacterium]MBX3533707.1 winged helix-turn-helix transcriptional regulator [Xanthobacteraceae bacterium]MCW5675481.1 winged helix-turn-helix transcriptional regulator [Xanthobacteraceae bacterium]MCW5676531.1 winged helix-turn-helix transcriptional regulator [Xanthobacteraceae bacterium]
MAAKRTDIHRCACTILRQAARVATQHFDRTLATSGLRISQLSVLTTLRYVGPKTINELAEIMVLDRTTLGRNLKPLEREGYLAVEAGEDDRRTKQLVLTKKGEKVAVKAMDSWSDAQTSFEQAIGLDNAIALSKLLRQVVKADYTK